MKKFNRRSIRDYLPDWCTPSCTWVRAPGCDHAAACRLAGYCAMLVAWGKCIGLVPPSAHMCMTLLPHAATDEGKSMEGACDVPKAAYVQQAGKDHPTPSLLDNSDSTRTVPLAFMHFFCFVCWQIFYLFFFFFFGRQFFLLIFFFDSLGRFTSNVCVLPYM